MADAVQWNPKPDSSPSPPTAVVVESTPPPVVLEIPKETTLTEAAVAPESSIAPAPPIIVEPPLVVPSASRIPEIAIGLGDIPVIALAGAALAAFAAGTFLMRGRSEVSEVDTPSKPSPFLSSSTTDLISTSDVSIPYDAAARLEYDKWRAKYGKGAFDAEKYAKFKARYEAVTSTNMAAKKVARDTGTLPTLKGLAADADS